VTRIRLELKELQSQVDRWKITQLSPQFHRVSNPTGARLNSIRNDLTSQINVVKLRLKQAEEELLRFPELPSAAPNLVRVDEEMMAYTDELKSWLTSFAALVVPETRPSAPSDSFSSSAMDVEPYSKVEEPISLLAEIEEHITQLEDKLGDAELAIHDSDVVSPERNAAYIEQGISAARSKMTGGDPSQTKPAGGDGSVAGLQSAANDVEKKLASQADQVVLLLERNQLGKERIKALEADRDRNNNLQLAVCCVRRFHCIFYLTSVPDASSARSFGRAEGNSGQTARFAAGTNHAIC
jgi:hypothetical protein